MTTRSPERIPDPLPLVGRTTELAELEALLDQGDGGTSIVFIRGDSGVGKSRLVEELAERAGRRHWRVAKGRAYPVETGVPYALFADAWLPIVREMDSSTLTVLTRGGERELSYLFPSLAQRGAGYDDLGVEDPDEFRTRLMWNFAEFAKRYADREPILCVLEDLQWADQSSLQLLHFLARQTAGSPLLLICTYSDQERDRSPQLIQTERSLEALGAAQILRLEPLARDHVEELVRRTFGMGGDSVREFSAVLYGWTRGNPFFVQEIVKSLVASGQLRKEAGTWVGWDAKDFTMPGSIRDAVLQGIGSLGAEAQSIAELAAVVGTRASYGLLSSLSGIEAHGMLAALAELGQHRIFDERSEDGEVVYHFAHPLVRQILYNELGLARARMLHGTVAEAMESHYGPRAIDHADELAYHFSNTDAGPLRAKAAHYLAEAGRRALERRADTEAIHYLQTAREHVGLVGDEEAMLQAEVDLIPLLARAHTHLGQFREATELWGQVLGAMPPTGKHSLSVRRMLAMCHFWCGDHEAAHENLDVGIEEARATEDGRSLVRFLVAKAHCLHELGRGTDALETLHPALTVADEIGDPWLLARVHRALALLHVWVGPPQEATAHAERAIALAKEVGDLSIEFWARWGLAVQTGMRGDTVALEAAIDRVNDIADRARSPVLRLWTADMAVELAFARGEWDRGIAEGNRAITLARSLNQRTLLPRILVWTSQFFVARGDLERALELVTEAEEVAGLDSEAGPHDVHQVVPTYLGKAHYLVALGDYEGAIEAAKRGLAIAEGTGYILWAIHQALPVLAEACLWAERVEEAEEVGRRMREHAEKIDHRLGIAWADACDALVCWKRGNPEESIPLMRAAADQLEAIPMTWHAARLRRQLAARLWEAGRPEEAKAELDQVWDVYVGVGAGEEKEKARADYRKMGLRAPVEHRTDGPLGLTPEEFEVAKLVARGLSNPAIAKARDSRVRTISTHLSNIYKKLEVGGSGARMRLANIVREAHLLD